MTIPNSITKIRSSVFRSCISLASVTVRNDDPANITLGDTVFSNVPTSTCILYVPAGSKDLYAAADQWKDFLNIEELAAGIENTLIDNNSENAEAPYYDLMRRRVENPAHGIYIHNGRKVLVK